MGKPLLQQLLAPGMSTCGVTSMTEAHATFELPFPKFSPPCGECHTVATPFPSKGGGGFEPLSKTSFSPVGKTWWRLRNDQAPLQTSPHLWHSPLPQPQCTPQLHCQETPHLLSSGTRPPCHLYLASRHTYSPNWGLSLGRAQAMTVMKAKKNRNPVHSDLRRAPAEE